MIGEYESIFVFVKMIALLETRRFSKHVYGSKVRTRLRLPVQRGYVILLSCNFFRTKLINTISISINFGDDVTTFFMTTWR